MAQSTPSNLPAILRDSLEKGQQPRLTVTSGSMAPLIQVGDQVILEAVQPEQLKPGDIITLSSPQGLLTHRLWAVQFLPEAQTVLTRGDRPLVFDPVWPVSAVVGRVCARSRGQRQLSLQTGAGQWLNRHLAALARWEYRRISGSQEVLIQRIEPIRPTFQVKMLHRFCIAWALLITSSINLAARTNQI